MQAQTTWRWTTWQLMIGAWRDGTAGPDVPADRAEALLVARARAGDHAAFGWLLERYRRRAVGLAAHVLRRESEAEERVASCRAHLVAHKVALAALLTRA